MSVTHLSPCPLNTLPCRDAGDSAEAAESLSVCICIAVALLLGSTWQLWRRSEGLDTAALLCMQICLAAGAAILLSELQESETTTASLFLFSCFVFRFKKSSRRR